MTWNYYPDCDRRARKAADAKLEIPLLEAEKLRLEIANLKKEAQQQSQADRQAHIRREAQRNRDLNERIRRHDYRNQTLVAPTKSEDVPTRALVVKDLNTLKTDISVSVLSHKPDLLSMSAASKAWFDPSTSTYHYHYPR